MKRIIIQGVAIQVDLPDQMPDGVTYRDVALSAIHSMNMSNRDGIQALGAEESDQYDIIDDNEGE